MAEHYPAPIQSMRTSGPTYEPRLSVSSSPIDPRWEPPEAWKKQLKESMKISLDELKQAAERDYQKRLDSDPSSDAFERAREEFESQMHGFAKMAHENFEFELNKERAKRKQMVTLLQPVNADPMGSEPQAERRPSVPFVNPPTPSTTPFHGKAPSPAPAPRLPIPNAARPSQGPLPRTQEELHAFPVRPYLVISNDSALISMQSRSSPTPASDLQPARPTAVQPVRSHFSTFLQHR